MVATPEFTEPPEELVALVNRWYDTHRETYQWVWEQLDEIRRTWALADRQTKIGLLKGSYIFQLFTQRVQTDLAEESFLRVINGTDVPIALQETGAGFHNDKTATIYQAFWADETWDTVVDLIDTGNINAAHQMLVDDDRVKGVKTAKAAFVLANVGLTQKMCLDSNVSRLLGQDYEITGDCTSNTDCKEKYPDMTSPKCIGGSCVSDPAPTTSQVSQYESVCADIRSFFPELSAKMEPYHLQWLLFDLQRHFRFGDRIEDDPFGGIEVPGIGAVATHTVWFDMAINRPQDIKQRMQTVTHNADQVWEVFSTDPKYSEYTDLTSAIHPSNLGSEEMSRILSKAKQPGPIITDSERIDIENTVEEAIERDLSSGDMKKIHESINEAIDDMVD